MYCSKCPWTCWEKLLKDSIKEMLCTISELAWSNLVRYVIKHLFYHGKVVSLQEIKNGKRRVVKKWKGLGLKGPMKENITKGAGANVRKRIAQTYTANWSY